MTNAIESFEPRNGINAQAHRKEAHFHGALIVVDLDTGATPIELRSYGTSTRGSNSACLWIHRNPVYASGSGRAGGYGYHRPSAAAQSAFEAAGVKLAQPIDGHGDSAMFEAMEALARHLEIPRFAVIRSHP